MNDEKLKHQIYGEQEEYESDGFLDALKAAGKASIGVGKIYDI